METQLIGGIDEVLLKIVLLDHRKPGKRALGPLLVVVQRNEHPGVHQVETDLHSRRQGSVTLDGIVRIGKIVDGEQVTTTPIRRIDRLPDGTVDVGQRAFRLLQALFGSEPSGVAVDGGNDEDDEDDHDRDHCGAVPANELREPIRPARRPRPDRFVPEVPAQVIGKAERCLVPAITIDLQCLEEDPVEIALELAHQPATIASSPAGDRLAPFRLLTKDAVQARAGPDRRSLTENLLQCTETAFLPCPRDRVEVDGRASDEQFVEDRAQREHICPHVHILSGEAGLLGSHVVRRADELTFNGHRSSANGVGIERLRDPEIDHPGKQLLSVRRDKDVPRLEITVDDALAMCMLDRLADLDEELDPTTNVELQPITELVHRAPGDVLHDEVGIAILGRTRVDDRGQAGMAHHRERLPLRLETHEHVRTAKPRSNDLDRDITPDGLFLMGEEDDTESTLAEATLDLVGPDGQGIGFEAPGRLQPVTGWRAGLHSGGLGGQDVRGPIRNSLQGAADGIHDLGRIIQTREPGFQLGRRDLACLPEEVFDSRELRFWTGHGCNRYLPGMPDYRAQKP